jgi:hypothetical protein
VIDLWTESWELAKGIVERSRIGNSYGVDLHLLALDLVLVRLPSAGDPLDAGTEAVDEKDQPEQKCP